MGSHEKLLWRVLQGVADDTIRFDDLRSLLRRLGFEEYVNGSHHVLKHPDVPKLINIQPRRGYAKGYQVRQVRHILEAHPHLWRR